MLGDGSGLAEPALALRGLLLQDVARERVTALDLAVRGHLEALFGARFRLHFWHRFCN